ncbi:chromate efflux transporter [Pontibacter anaerobius]|uniref:Chromate efflux transporter n=1 Tax=Pontibacter anaerobius TaxID=2993940 RepID=A0ABT3R9J6_9BACT|nr:chromate efflux transporter [Pontibacter anaerobius]MCX2738458.1 chromate efflux transporter [Pontibacter anaerobius]
MKPKNGEVQEVGKLFLKLGTIAFGGPAAHIAMMEDEVVKKRQWMTHEHFLDLVGATNLIPGPNSTEMTMHCGYERGGWRGLILAGAAFILPAVLITMVFAWLYSKYGQLPEVEPYIYGIKPAVIAIILSALISLGKKALKNVELWVLGILTVLAALLGVNEIVALFACGFAGLLLYFIRSHAKTANGFSPLILLQAPLLAVQSGNLKIWLIFLKVGALLYGSGYVLFAFLDAELVSNGLLTRQELIDAVAVGQFTPGPVLSTATFIGWQLNGFWGALAATVGIFLPSFVFVAILNPLIPKLRKSKAMSAFLDAVNVAAVAVILAVAIEMSRDTLTDWRTVLIAIISFAAVFVFKKLNSAFIVIGGAVLGYLLMLV